MTYAQLRTLAPMIEHDSLDGALFDLYTRLRPKLSARGRIALLAGIAGFDRNWR